MSGLWTQPFILALLLFFIHAQGLSAGVSGTAALVLLSFFPSVYAYSENTRQAAAGKQDFSLDDIFHSKPSEYASPLKNEAMFPKVPEELLFDAPEGIVLGRIREGHLRKKTRYLCKPISEGHYRDGHVLIVGGSGSGKSSAVIIPSLLSCPHIGIFCLDIKGELHEKSRRLDDEDTVIVDFQDRRQYGWDALWMLNRKASGSGHKDGTGADGAGFVREQDVKETMELIAESLIPITVKDSSAFWKQSARSLLTGELVGLYQQKKIRNLSALMNEILSRDARELVKELTAGARPGAIERKLLSSFVNLVDETLTGIVQNEEEALRIFSDEDIRYGLENNPRKASPEMIENGKAVFLSIREEKLESYSCLVNLIIGQIFHQLIRRPETAPPVLIIIDEMARICAKGPIPLLHNGILLTGRSRNITLILATQSYEALENAYTKADIESMAANCAYLAVLDVRSQTTAKSICSMAGTYKERETTWNQSGGRRSLSVTYRPRPILEPSDLARLVVQDDVVLISSRYGYCRPKKCSYFSDALLGPKADRIKCYNLEASELEPPVNAAEPEAYGPETYDSETYEPETYGPESCGPEIYEPETYGPDTSAPQPLI